MRFTKGFTVLKRMGIETLTMRSSARVIVIATVPYARHRQHPAESRIFVVLDRPLFGVADDDALTLWVGVAKATTHVKLLAANHYCHGF